MIAWLLSLVPFGLTGRVGPRARREVRGWTKNNATLRTLRYGSFRRCLMWGADHPVLFALLLASCSAGMAYLAAGQRWTFAWHLPGPKLDEKFDAGAYTGVPWGVQATLVALVYPIVLSFIALMLQRRAHSTVALRVYVLDAAVVPAGASAIGLLLTMGAQYFASPYSSNGFLAEYLGLLLAFNGIWFGFNIFLTGFFLSRTVRFIQDDEQRHVYTRVAVDVALRSELTSAVKQHLFVNAPQEDWRLSAQSNEVDKLPQVHMFRTSDGSPAVKRDLKGSLMLHDVHLLLLKVVVGRWVTRAKLQSSDRLRQPTLEFPPMVGEIATGDVVLCSVANGPELTAFERFLVRTAFCYRPSRLGTLSLSTKKMLEEIGAEVEAAAEQHRFGAAEDGLRNVIRLHKTLLLASAADQKGSAENAATIGTSPYGWGSNTFDIEWLKPYCEVGRIAVKLLDEDSRLFRTLAVVPASIAAELPPKPEKLVIDAQMVATNLMYQLGGWWTRKADAGLAPGAKKFDGMLPAPIGKVYEQALIAFVGSFGDLHIRVPMGKSAEETWAAMTARALVYASHIDNSALFFLKAVSRGDEVGSRWLLDSFLKWCGNRQHELDCGDPDEFNVRHATLSLAEKAWLGAIDFLWNGDEPVDIGQAGKAMNLGIRRYWESMRLYLALLLIHNAGPTPETDCRELRLAAALVQGTPQHRGGNADCWDLVLRPALISPQ